MSGRLIHMRASSPDGATVITGPLSADVIATAVQLGGAPWHILLTRGWRLEPVMPPEPEGQP